MGNKQNWAANAFRLKKAQGKTEDMAGPSQQEAMKNLFKDDGDRSARLRHYISTAPSGERDLDPILEKRMDEVLPSGQTRRERNAWLRGILDSPE